MKTKNGFLCLNNVIQADMPKYESEASRISCRSIVYQEGLLLMVALKRTGVYKFPGGGVESGETFEQAVIRETEEEAGYIIIPESLQKCVYICEIREAFYEENTIFHQESYYFLANVMKEPVAQHLSGHELIDEYYPIWVSIDEAIAHNHVARENLIKAKLFNSLYHVDRELTVLTYLQKKFKK